MKVKSFVFSAISALVIIAVVSIWRLREGNSGDLPLSPRHGGPRSGGSTHVVPERNGNISLTQEEIAAVVRSGNPQANLTTLVAKRTRENPEGVFKAILKYADAPNLDRLLMSFFTNLAVFGLVDDAIQCLGKLPQSANKSYLSSLFWINAKGVTSVQIASYYHTLDSDLEVNALLGAIQSNRNIPKEDLDSFFSGIRDDRRAMAHLSREALKSVAASNGLNAGIEYARTNDISIKSVWSDMLRQATQKSESETLGDLLEHSKDLSSQEVLGSHLYAQSVTDVISNWAQKDPVQAADAVQNAVRDNRYSRLADVGAFALVSAWFSADQNELASWAESLDESNLKDAVAYNLARTYLQINDNTEARTWASRIRDNDRRAEIMGALNK